MVTALKLFTTNTNDSTITTARDCVATLGAPGTTAPTTLCGTSTGFSQIFAQGTAGAWGAFTKIQPPDGHGFFLPSATLALAGQQIPAGNWTPRFRGKISVGTATADLWVAVYIYNTVAAVYTALGTLELAAQALSTVLTNYDWVAAALPQWNFGSNDILYFEEWMNITVNGSGSGAATINMTENSSTTVGLNASTTLATPGYQPIPPSAAAGFMRTDGRSRVRYRH